MIEKSFMVSGTKKKPPWLAGGYGRRIGFIVALTGYKKKCKTIANLSEKGCEKRDFLIVSSLGDSRCSRTGNSRQ